MPQDQSLQVWVQKDILDPEWENNQTELLSDTAFAEGLLRKYGLAAQDFNQLMWLITSRTPTTRVVPFHKHINTPLDDNTLVMNGQALTSATPALFEVYGSVLTDMTAVNLPDHVLCVRKQ